MSRGWTQSSINTSGLGWADDFGLHVDLDNPNLNRGNTLYFGLINAAPFLVGSVLGLIINDQLQVCIPELLDMFKLSPLIVVCKRAAASLDICWRGLLCKFYWFVTHSSKIMNSHLMPLS
jgi:hypothetical protein